MQNYLKSRSASASRNSRMSTLTATGNKLPAASGSFNDLFLILQQHGIEHLATHIAECGFGVNDIGNVFKTDADISRLLRVTNRADKAKLVALSAHIRSIDERFLAGAEEAELAAENEGDQQNADEEGGAGGRPPTAPAASSGAARRSHSGGGGGVGNMSTISTSSTAAAVAQQTFLHRLPTNATANEYCRQAATFLEHYRVDRAWPKRRSVLSRTLGLPTAEDPIAVKHRTAQHVANHKVFTATGGGGAGTSRTSTPNRALDDGATTTVTSSQNNNNTISYETGGNGNGDGDDEEAEIFRVYQRPARHFSVDTDDDRNARHAKSVADREAAIARGQYGGSWREVGQRNPDKGGRLDPFPTAKGPTQQQLHALHSHHHGHGHDGDCDAADGTTNLYATHTVHKHGCQARQCPVCRHHARERAGDGSWQFLAMVRLPPQFDAAAVAVDLKAIIKGRSSKKKRRQRLEQQKERNQLRHGFDEFGNPTATLILGSKGIEGNGDDDGASSSESSSDGIIRNEKGEELVPMWVPFSAAESLVLETAYRKKAISILVRGKLANLGKMRWNRRPLRRSHNGDVPFLASDFGIKAGNGEGGGDTDDEVEAMEEALRKAAEAARLAKEIRDSFLALLGAEESKSRSVIEAEEDTLRRSLAADLDRGRRQIINNLLEGIVRAEETARRGIRAEADAEFENNILAPLADQLRQEEVRRLARAEIAAAQAILAQQRALVGDHEAAGRRAIEEEEADEWAKLERAIRHLHAQIALFHRQLHADRNGGDNGNGNGIDDGTRCAKCLDGNCPFHRRPWANHWRRIGGALDLKPYALGIDSLDGLIATALDKQFSDLGGTAAGAAGGWGSASASASAAGGGAAAVGQLQRARGTAGMRYNSSQRKAKYTDTYSIDAYGNVTTNTPNSTAAKTSVASAKDAHVAASTNVNTTPAAAAAGLVGGGRPSSSAVNRRSSDSDDANGLAAASSVQHQPRRPMSASAAGRLKTARPPSAGPPPAASARPQSATPPPPPPAAAQPSNYVYPSQVPVRLRRQQEEERKPAPFRHSAKAAALDPNDVYRAPEESDRGPSGLSPHRASPRRGAGGARSSSRAGASSAAAAGGYGGYEPARFAPLGASVNASSSIRQSPPPPRASAGRMKSARPGRRSSYDEEGGAEGEGEEGGLGVVEGEEEEDVAPTAASSEDAVLRAAHGKRFGFGVTAKQNDKIRGDEYKPKVVSHYERMRRKLGRGGTQNLAHLAAM